MGARAAFGLLNLLLFLMLSAFFMVCPQGAGGMAAERIRAGLRLCLLRPDGKHAWGNPALARP